MASAQDEGTSLGAPTWRVEMGNDLFFDSDNAFTNGFNVRKHSAIFEDIDDVPGGGVLMSGLLPERDGLLYLVDDDQWTEQHTIEAEDGVGSIILGVHYVRPRWGIHFNFWFTSDTHKPETVEPSAEDATNDFGTIMFEWRF